MSWAGAAARWFRGLAVTADREASEPTGTPVLSCGADAVLAVEVLASDRVCRSAPAVEARHRGSRSAGPNAFGRPVQELVAENGGGVLAAGAGQALGGLRVSVLLPESRLEENHGALNAAAARRVPLVVHAVTTADTAASTTIGVEGHGAYHALTDTGVLLGLARNAQRAVDMALVARRAAELALVPAVVVMDGPENAWAPQSVRLPDAALVRDLLGEPGGRITSPTADQRMLLGEQRARVPSWYDPDRPAAHGVLQSGQDLSVALAGQRQFHSQALAGLLRESAEKVARATGRPLSLVSRHRLRRARHAFIAQGSAIDAAEAVADYLANERGERVGVLGIEWLRPLAVEEIREALEGVETATVLERTGDAVADGPLMREVRNALGSGGPELLHAVYGLGGQPLSNADLLAVYENMRLGAAARRSVLLGIAFPEAHPDQPRREVLSQRVRGAFPDLERSALTVPTPLDLRPRDAKTVALWTRRTALPAHAFDALASAVSSAAGEHVRSRAASREHGTWMGQVTASPTPLREPGDVVLHDAVLLAAPDLPASTNPLSRVVLGGIVLVTSSLSPSELWRELPRSWREVAIERQLRLHVVNATVEELIRLVPWLLGSEGEPDDRRMVPRRVDLDPLSKSPSEAKRAAPPLAVRRFTRAGSTYDNVPRFWGEVVQPRLESGSAEPSPDPYLSLAAVPPSTAGLYEAAVRRHRLPRIDPERCTGCGACWTACPDSAIAPTAIGTVALLDAMAAAARDPAAEPDPVASKLERAHRQLGARIDGTLAKQKAPALGESTMRESFEWLVAQMKISEADRPAFVRAFEPTLRNVLDLPIAATAAFFHSRHSEKKGSGELLALAVSPRACQACGGCGEVCPEGAIHIEARTDTAVASAAASWAAWEHLPDTPGESIARAATLPEVGGLPAVLTSRHTLLTVTGGGGHEPGSGTRLGARLVAAATEYQRQRRVITRLGAVRSLSERLHAAVREGVTSALPTEHLDKLARALERVPDRSSNLGELVRQLDGLGERATVDNEHVGRLVSTARAVDRLESDLTAGEGGLGRARFGLVVASEPIATWAAEFPRNPFSVPVVVDLSTDGLDLALGLAGALVQQHVEQIRMLRSAELLLASPTELAQKERDLDNLVWADLSDEERAHCPALIVLAGYEALSGALQGGLSRLLASRVPAKVVVLEGREQLLGASDPLMPYLLQREAFVLSTTVAHREHLFEGMTAALDYPGPALVHVYAPSPHGHGFETEHTIERARLAVDCRVHPLLRLDPTAPGVFGARLSLAGNPAVEVPWVETDGGASLTPAHFALGERRFEDRFTEPDGVTQPVADWAIADDAARAATRPAVKRDDGKEVALDSDLREAVIERIQSWRVLQELAGIVTPFTEHVRAAAEDGSAHAHRQELDDLRAEHERALAAARAGQQADTLDRVRARLLQLAGYGRPEDGRGGEKLS